MTSGHVDDARILFDEMKEREEHEDAPSQDSFEKLMTVIVSRRGEGFFIIGVIRLQLF